MDVGNEGHGGIIVGGFFSGQSVEYAIALHANTVFVLGDAKWVHRSLIRIINRIGFSFPYSIFTPELYGVPDGHQLGHHLIFDNVEYTLRG